MIRRPPRSTLDRSSAASDVYKRQAQVVLAEGDGAAGGLFVEIVTGRDGQGIAGEDHDCLLYTSPSPRDRTRSRMPSSA